jgi:hypothetical protein
VCGCSGGYEFLVIVSCEEKENEREGKGREGKGREGKEGKGIQPCLQRQAMILFLALKRSELWAASEMSTQQEFLCAAKRSWWKCSF